MCSTYSLELLLACLTAAFHCPCLGPLLSEPSTHPACARAEPPSEGQQGRGAVAGGRGAVLFHHKTGSHGSRGRRRRGRSARSSMNAMRNNAAVDRGSVCFCHHFSSFARAFSPANQQMMPGKRQIGGDKFTLNYTEDGPHIEGHASGGRRPGQRRRWAQAQFVQAQPCMRRLQCGGSRQRPAGGSNMVGILYGTHMLWAEGCAGHKC